MHDDTAHEQIWKCNRMLSFARTQWTDFNVKGLANFPLNTTYIHHYFHYREIFHTEKYNQRYPFLVVLLELGNKQTWRLTH